MKAIEDLGVSPMPWGAEQNGVPYVVDANGYNVATIDGDSIGQACSNTFLLKTAPKLYEAGNAAYDALEGLCPWYGKCLKCLHGCYAAKDGEFLDSKKEYCGKSDRADCMVFIALSKLRAALAEARGEEIK